MQTGILYHYICRLTAGLISIPPPQAINASRKGFAGESTFVAR